MKVSFICTVLNEEGTIERLLRSLLKQSRLPDEVVICDGGSKDKTKIKIINFIKNIKDIKVIFLEDKEINRSEGRNRAIKKATGEIIVASDAGCVLDKKWLEEIVMPFRKYKNVEVVGGFYLPTGDSILQKILGGLTSVPLKKINPETFLPSSRSIAFKKSAWRKIGGYSENLNYCEDLVFDLNLKKFGFKFAFCPKAIVFWPQKRTFLGAIKQFFNYAVGDGMAGERGPHFKKHVLGLGFLGVLGMFGILGKLGLLGLVVFGFFGYKAFKLTPKVKKILVWPMALFLLPTLNLIVLAGFVYGTFKRYEEG